MSMSLTLQHKIASLNCDSAFDQKEIDSIVNILIELLIKQISEAGRVKTKL